MEQRTFLVKDLKRMISESASEFKPVIGPNVTSDNKKNSEKAYKEAEKQAKDLDGGLKDPKKGKLADKEDANRTTLDYNPRTEPDKNFKEKVKAQAKGYTSTMEEKNKIEKAAEFDEDGKIFNLSFVGGCNGNLKAISRLCEGKSLVEIEEVLRGNTCGPKDTSCADQLAKAIKEVLEA